MRKLISQGAEAKIFLSENKIIKQRIAKSYRSQQLDEKIRKSRTKKEAKILEKASKTINVPKLIFPYSEQDKYCLVMQHIQGDKISEKLDSYKATKQKQIMQQLATSLAKLHQQDIIHGDLTTSNMILKQNQLYLIDFGLSFISKRIEDKAVDLHLIKQALQAKHWKNFEKLFQIFQENYKKHYKDSEKVLLQFKKVQSRGRYKH